MCRGKCIIEPTNERAYTVRTVRMCVCVCGYGWPFPYSRICHGLLDLASPPPSAMLACLMVSSHLVYLPYCTVLYLSALPLLIPFFFSVAAIGGVGGLRYRTAHQAHVAVWIHISLSDFFSLFFFFFFFFLSRELGMILLLLLKRNLLCLVHPEGWKPGIPSPGCRRRENRRFRGSRFNSPNERACMYVCTAQQLTHFAGL